MKQYEILVRGRVQGVYFRASAQNRAISLGLNGWVRNEPDGSVRMRALGPEAALKDLAEWCKQGPITAEVSEVIVTEQTPETFRDFMILR